MSAPRRSDRVAREIQREVARLIQREVRDPRVSEVTITRVELSDDLREARVFFVPLGGVGSEDRIKELDKGLGAAAAFLQRGVGKNLRLRSTPRLTFHYDRGVENLIRVHDMLHGMKVDEDEGEGS